MIYSRNIYNVISRNYIKISKLSIASFQIANNNQNNIFPKRIIRNASSSENIIIDITKDSDLLRQLSEATDFASLGLGGYSPVGIIQNILESLHTQVGLPWWASIMSLTVFFRLAMFPILVAGTRASAKMTLISPQMREIQDDMRKAMKSGNQLLAEQHAVNYRAMLVKNNIKLSRQFISIGTQIPVFICYFLAIRGIYTAELPSLAAGGALWFPNLLIPDPYFILPSTTVISLITHLHIGEARATMELNPLYKYGIIAMSLCVFPFACRFPSALTIYWATSNILGIIHAFALGSPKISKMLDIPSRKMTTEALASSKAKQKSIFATISETVESWKDASIQRSEQRKEKRMINQADKEKAYVVLQSADELEKLVTPKVNTRREKKRLLYQQKEKKKD